MAEETTTIKTLQTRIALKYDTYANWTTVGKDLILLHGEIGLCEIPREDTSVTTAPTVLFKVGDGTHSFKDLSWASATAADVYKWAKAKSVELEGKILKFKSGDNVLHSVDLSSFALSEDIDTTASAVSALGTRVDNLEASLGGGSASQDGSVASRLANLEGRLEDLTAEADTPNSIKYIATEKANAAKEAIIGTDSDTKDSNTIKGAKKYTDSVLATYSSGISAAVSTLSDRVTTTENNLSGLSGRLDRVETFFTTAEDQTINEALDTLVEIQNYITTGDGEVAGGIINQISTNTNNITTNANAITALDGRVTNQESGLSDIKASLENNGSIGMAITAASNAAATAQTSANEAKTAAGQANAAINNTETGLVKTKEIADAAKSAAEANSGEIANIKNDIADIQAKYLKETDYLIISCGTSTTNTD